MLIVLYKCLLIKLVYRLLKHISMKMNSTHISVNKLYFLQFLSSILLFIIIFVTIIGNVLLITAINTTPKLKISPNYLILSLSITDLCIGVFAMPLMAYYNVVDLDEWTMGPVMCDIKTFIPINLTSTSYIHLLFIAIDRYLSVTRIQYSRNESRSHLIAMIGISWIVPPIITICSILGWRDNQAYLELIAKHICYPAGNNMFVRYCVIVVSLLELFVIPTLYYRVYMVKTII